MHDPPDDKSSKTNVVKIIFGIIAFVLCIVLSVFVGSNLIRTRSKLQFTFSSYKQKSIESFPYQQNTTHLWSIRFADENYFRLASLLPCRTINYTAGPIKIMNELDSCDNSSTKEFSVENSLKAQKWLYEHQHPMDCTNKRFAIIRNFAWSGFGSALHQIVWAFGTAIADNRIAVYAKPGNWVR
jgi:hypothetical protein